MLAKHGAADGSLFACISEAALRIHTNKPVATMSSDAIRCLVVDKCHSEASLNVLTMPAEQLGVGTVEIEVHWSSLNYKDALAATGHPGVVKQFPHVPGIDAAGIVLSCTDGIFQAGDQVLVTGYDLGQGHWGGWSERIRVPSEWVVSLNRGVAGGLSERDAMVYGTAGFTAAQCVMALECNGVKPESGEVIVTGATGGVGSLALRILSHLGYRVVAVTGKTELTEQLIELGAKRVIGRNELLDETTRPLLNSRWAGGVDTVGGHLLTSLLRSTQYGGCVAACGLVAGADLNMTLYPFLLRGVTLSGIGSADCPREKRLRIWDLLAGPWRPANLNQLVSEVSLEQLAVEVQRILAGQQTGRIIVNPLHTF